MEPATIYESRKGGVAVAIGSMVRGVFALGMVRAASLFCVLSWSAGVAAEDVSREVSGWYNDGWNAQSHASYMAHPNLFSEINPYWYDLGTQENLVLADGSVSERAYAYSAEQIGDAHSQGDLVIPSIADHAVGQIDTVLSSPSARQALSANLLGLVLNRGYDGIDLNFESGTPNARAQFTAFIDELAAAFHQEGKRLVVTVRAASNMSEESAAIFDYAGLGASGVDRIKIMAYDHNFAAGVNVPGPIAPLAWVRSVLSYAITTRGVPSSKIQLGLHDYAWTWKKVGGKWQLQTPHDTFQGVAQKSGASAWQWDASAAESWKQYTYAGKNYLSYVGTADTVAARIGLADEFDLAGLALWVLGREDPNVYARVCSYFGSSCIPEPVLLSQAKPTAASSTFDNTYTATKAVDGNFLLGWLADPSENTSWLRVDLQSPHTLTRIRVQWGRFDWPIAYDVQVSADGTSWTTSHHEANNVDGGLDIIDISNTSARYVRVLCLGPKSDNWSYEIYELQVFGMP